MKRIGFFFLFYLLCSCTLFAEKYIVNASSLNVRNDPNLNGEVLFRVKKGQAVEVKEFRGAWAYIDLSDGSGWVAKRYLISENQVSNNAISSKKKNKYRTKEKLEDETVHKTVTWIIRIALYWGVLCFIVLIIPAFKRKKLISHIFIFGALVGLLYYANLDVYTLARGVALGCVVSVLLWPLLYFQICEDAIKGINWFLMLGTGVILYFML